MNASLMLSTPHCRCNIPPLSFTTKFILYHMVRIVISGFHIAIFISEAFFWPYLACIFFPLSPQTWQLKKIGVTRK